MAFRRSFLLKVLPLIMLAFFCLPSHVHALTKRDEDLIYHSNFGKAEKVKSLLETGADPNAVGEDGWPALSLAIMRGDKAGYNIVRFLINAGADLNIRDPNGEPPLMNAISINSPALVKLLIEHGADFHATNTKGDNVKAFAKHYADEEVSFLINEAMRIEKQRIHDGLSPKRMYRIMDDFIYFSCAMQYMAYNKAINLYPKERFDEIDKLISQAVAKLGNAEVELQHSFYVGDSTLKLIYRTVQQQIFDELESLISVRNRIKHGVGTNEDLDARCKKILGYWRKSYKEYEEQGIMKDSSGF